MRPMHPVVNLLLSGPHTTHRQQLVLTITVGEVLFNLPLVWGRCLAIMARR